MVIEWLLANDNGSNGGISISGPWQKGFNKFFEVPTIAENLDRD
jgi:hypothetical protein